MGNETFTIPVRGHNATEFISAFLYQSIESYLLELSDHGYDDDFIDVFLWTFFATLNNVVQFKILPDNDIDHDFFCSHCTKHRETGKCEERIRFGYNKDENERLHYNLEVGQIIHVHEFENIISRGDT